MNNKVATVTIKVQLALQVRSYSVRAERLAALAVLMAGKVDGQSRVLGPYPLNDTLQRQPAGRAALQQLELVDVGEFLKFAVELPSVGTENTGTKSGTRCLYCACALRRIAC